jgi:hypothetical protein
VLNPYEPPISPSTKAIGKALGIRISPFWRTCLLLAGFGLAIVGARFLFYGRWLSRTYPDLQDKRPNVDWSWPLDAYYASLVIGIAASCFGALMLIVASVAIGSRRRPIASDTQA